MQLELPLSTWGGKRAGAGRPASRKGRVPHVTRPRHAARHPVHVTMRAVRLLPALRHELIFLAVRDAIARAHKEHFRVVHFSIQRDHVHLLVEATDRELLWRGMQGLAIRIARAVNRVLGRRGGVWADRYHRRDLFTPREVRHALVYVLMNHRKHEPVTRELDACSSALWFEGWSNRAGAELACVLSLEAMRDRRVRTPVMAPRTWLARVGWQRHGWIEPNERPASG